MAQLTVAQIEEKGDFVENSIWRYKEVALKYFNAEEVKNNELLKYYIEEGARQFREKTRPAGDLELFEKLMKIYKENI